MPQSQILNYGSRHIKQSLFLNWIYKKVDPKEGFKYSSVIISRAEKPVLFLNYMIEKFGHLTYVAKLSSIIDLKSIVLFLFILVQVIFPGYGTENTGVAFLPGSPTGSIANRYGFAWNLVIFTISLAALGIVFLKDIAKNSKGFNFSKFEIILILFIISLEISSIFSVYSGITFTWFIKVCRGFAIYFIFSRLVIEKKHIMTICLAFMAAIYFESILAFAQYIYGGFLGLPIETAPNAISANQLYTVLNEAPVFRPSGTIGQGNGLSFLFALMLPFSLILLFSKSKISKVIPLISIFLSAIVSFMTLSRWGTVTLFFSAFSSLVLFYTSRLGRVKVRLLVRSILFFLIVILIFFIINNDFLSRFFHFSLSDISLSTRLQLIIQAIYVFGHNPWLGIGGGTFSQYLVNYDFTPLEISKVFPASVHNFFLLLLSETGIISFLLFVILISYLAISFYKFTSDLYFKQDRLKSLFVIALFSSIVIYLFGGVWELHSLSDRSAIIFWINLGLYFSIVRKNNYNLFN